MKDTNSQAALETSPPTSPVVYTKWRASLIAMTLSPGAGLAASALAALLMLFLRVIAGVPTPIELFGDFVLKHINTTQFLNLLRQFSPYPKLYPLGAALLGMIALGTALGLLYAAIVQIKLPANGYRPGRREWLTALTFSLVMTIIATALFWNELPQNFFGLPVDLSRLTTILGLLADFVVYGVVLCLAYRTLLPKVSVPGSPEEVVTKRRLLLSRVGVAALSVGGLAGTAGLVRTFLDGYSSYDGMQTFTHNGTIPAITTNADHYVVTQNPSDPTTNIDLWHLEVTGLIKNPGIYTFPEIQQLPSISRPITLQCIASGIGGHLISTAIWQGVTLRSLLEKHGGPTSNARYVAFYSIDGYSVSLPLNEVLMADAFLAWRMNGADIPQRHGYPMRVLILGRYGEENSKWLTRIELTEQPPLSADSWVFWSLQWTPTQRGTSTLQCRATDGTGEVQTSHVQGTVPNGGTGYNTKAIQVV